MAASVEDLLKDLEFGHSDFQVEHFIVGGGITDWGKYKQALREIHGRLQSHKKAGGDPEADREYRLLVKLARELKGRIGDIDEGKRAALEADYWVTKIKMMLALDYFAYGRPSREAMDMIAMLPRGMRPMVLPYLKDGRLALEWFEGQE